jgi:phosphonopyruvate decarboxylase
VIMHMGAMATIGQKAQPNFKHVIFNNGVHDSVGAQPTDAGSQTFKFTGIAEACGYKNVNIFSRIS